MHVEGLLVPEVAGVFGPQPDAGDGFATITSPKESVLAIVPGSFVGGVEAATAAFQLLDQH